MRVLIACEESQAVVKEFRRLGHEAYSCDIEECSGGHPEIHLRVDALELLKMRWDMIIAFPPLHFSNGGGCGSPLQLGSYNRGSGSLREGPSSCAILPGVLRRRLSTSGGRESGSDEVFRSSGILADHRTLSIRRSLAETDLSMDPRSSGAQTDERRRTQRIMGRKYIRKARSDDIRSIRASLEPRSETTFEDVSGHRASYGGTMGRR